MNNIFTTDPTHFGLNEPVGDTSGLNVILFPVHRVHRPTYRLQFDIAEKGSTNWQPVEHYFFDPAVTYEMVADFISEWAAEFFGGDDIPYSVSNLCLTRTLGVVL